ncbi:hypothetical protein EBH_0045840 [Eimeria brunetti]|uniref:SAG family member n=1 Tax=Eimeria brunetti TaxID=51314 RepID=U6LVV8_9EIME|nr:hypothetical protein EBH_0045840 [Eimeria brunetti]
MSTHLREGRSQSGDGASTGNAALFCEPALAAKADEAPFSEEYYGRLIARTALLQDMTEGDLKAPNDSVGPAAIPAILIGGFVAVLTAVSA